jgi:aminoglycoside phosphotransferase (APT) family kinase protein
VPELNLQALAARLDPVGVTDVRPLAGGASSLTYAGRLGERSVVVKVAPPGVAPVRNRDVLRQVRLLRALAPTPVPVPEVLWEDAGRPPDVPPLFVMSFVAGESVEPLFDVVGTDAVDGATMAARMLAAARTMALLHRIDLGSAGLGGEPVVSADEEIDRWCRVLQTVDQELVPGWPDVADGLRSSAPVPLAPALVHGDFRLGNLLAEGDRITAVVDWEIWSVGDPRVDLGWFLLNGDPDTYRRRARHAAALPSLAELASAYTEAVGRDAPWLGWFVALASFKSAATWSLIVKHNRRRSSPDGEVEAMVPVLPRLLARAHELAGPSPGS